MTSLFPFPHCAWSLGISVDTNMSLHSKMSSCSSVVLKFDLFLCAVGGSGGAAGPEGGVVRAVQGVGAD